MTICIKCRRPLKNPTATGMGPVCARAAKVAAPTVHERDLFGYDLAKAEQAALERLAIALAASTADAAVEVRRLFRAKQQERFTRWLEWRAEVMAGRAGEDRS